MELGFLCQFMNMAINVQKCANFCMIARKIWEAGGGGEGGGVVLDGPPSVSAGHSFEAGSHTKTSAIP